MLLEANQHVGSAVNRTFWQRLTLFGILRATFSSMGAKIDFQLVETTLVRSGESRMAHARESSRY